MSIIDTLRTLYGPKAASTAPPRRLICPSRGCYLERREPASEGTLTRCPRCGDIAAFRADGTLREATAAERAWFDDGPEAA